MSRLLIVPVLLVMALLPAAAAAQTTAPPGNAGVDEYVETVPSAAGNRPSRDGNGRGTAGADTEAGATAPGLTAAQQRALEAQGADGRALAQRIAAEAGADAGTGTGAGSAAGETRAPAGGTAAGSASQGDSAVRAILEAASGGGGSGGMGPLLPILLIGTVALFAAVALARRRTSD